MARAVYQTHPSFFRTSNPTDRRKFNALLKKQPSIEILDTIEEQLMEYIKCCSPKEKYTERVLRQKARAIFKETPKQDYGVWVHYPWLNKIVHLLDEREFVTVRTNRNQYKITPEERDLLSSKSIGVIGLSVGQSIALTIAMERICGEIRLADFDVVELSNLNRIRTGVHHLGLKKTVIVAREIAEIDPYLKVNCLHEGITENNIDAFFTEGGKLDLCLEECDGLFVKILTRQRAKIHRVPIVMNSSDRGTTDIERYDKSPEMPILHGLIDHLDVNKVKEAKTNEEKVPYLLPMLGVETSTARLKSSMLEIEQTINTWPQLASGVVLGGGITADVSRRVLLGELKKSGRYFVDLDELINDKLAGKNNVSKHPAAEELPHTAFSAFEKATAKLFKSKTYAQFSKPVKAKKLGKKTVKKLVDAACTAPSGGNVQPWKWVYQNKTLLLFHDRKRSASVLNYNNNAAYIGLGAATQNVMLAAESMGYKANLLSFPLGQKNDLTAAFLFSETKDSKPEAEALASFIHKRGTNRLLTKRAPLRAADKAGISSAVESIDNAQLHLVTSNQQLNAVKSILSSVDQLFLMNKKGHHHFMNEMRWTKAEAKATKEGVDIDTIDITPTERAGLEVSRNWEVTRNLKKWKLGSAYGKLTQKGVDAAAAIGIISMPKENAASFFEGGMALQNAWLAATKANLAFQPMSISTFLFELAASNDKANSDIKDIKKGLLALKQDFFSLFNLDNRIPVFIFRLGKTDHRTPVKSMRKDLKEVWRYADH
jgi:nitroreductase